MRREFFLYRPYTCFFFSRFQLVMFCVIITNVWRDIWNSYMAWGLPSFEYVRKSILTTSLRKARRGRDSTPSSLLIRYNTHTPWRTTSTIQTNWNHHHFFSFGYQSYTWPCSGPFCWQNRSSSCNSGTDLVVVLEHTFFQLCSSTKQISLRFARLRKSYANHPAIILINVTLLF